MHMCKKVAHLFRGLHRGAPLFRCTLSEHPVQIQGSIAIPNRSNVRLLSRASELDTKLSLATVSEHNSGSKENCEEIDIPEPEFNFEYLCDPENIEEIRVNIKHRKGVGDIDKVVSDDTFIVYNVMFRYWLLWLLFLF